MPSLLLGVIFTARLTLVLPIVAFSLRSSIISDRFTIAPSLRISMLTLGKIIYFSDELLISRGRIRSSLYKFMIYSRESGQGTTSAITWNSPSCYLISYNVDILKEPFKTVSLDLTIYFAELLVSYSF
jgi:hypothetical protein